MAPSFPTLNVPWLPEALAPVAQSGIFLVSGLASLVIGLTTRMSALTLIAILLVPITYLVLWKTTFGLRLRSVGENPDAADEPDAFCDRMADAIATALVEVRRRPPERRYAERMSRYRDLGVPLE